MAYWTLLEKLYDLVNSDTLISSDPPSHPNVKSCNALFDLETYLS